MTNPYIFGSDVFGTQIVKTDEYVMIAEIITYKGRSTSDAMLMIDCIDDLLQMRRMRLIIAGQRTTKTGKFRKDSSITDFFYKRLSVLLDDMNQNQQNEEENDERTDKE